jgi:hypothetical protein
VSAGAWAAATTAAVCVSWLGVHRVLGDGPSEQPRMLTAVSAPVPSSAPPLPGSVGSATARPRPSGSPGGGRHRATPAAATAPGAPATTPGNGASGDDSGQIQAFTRPGGRIVVDMGASSATLVTAIADAGWSVHQWTGTDWLRVDFEQGTSDSIFYVTWNGHPPLVQTWGP